MKRFSLRGIALLGMLCLIAGAMASATSIYSFTSASSSNPTITTTIAFPAAGDTFCTTVYGCGTLTAGGATDPMWTAGDNVVSSTFTTSGPIVGLSANWTFENFIGNGKNELWFVYVNNTQVAYFNAVDDNYNGDLFTVSGTVTFAPVPVASSYTVSLVLQNTLGFGDGSIDFLDGGVTGITSQAPVPEPGSLMLLGSGVVGLAGLLRRKLF